MEIKSQPTIQVLRVSADEWELYDLPGRDACAERLNNHFAKLVNAGNDRDSVRRDMEEFLDRSENLELGAGDTEGRYMVERLLKKVFG